MAAVIPNNNITILSVWSLWWKQEITLHTYIKHYDILVFISADGLVGILKVLLHLLHHLIGHTFFLKYNQNQIK